MKPVTRDTPLGSSASPARVATRSPTGDRGFAAVMAQLPREPREPAARTAGATAETSGSRTTPSPASPAEPPTPRAAPARPPRARTPDPAPPPSATQGATGSSALDPDAGAPAVVTSTSTSTSGNPAGSFAGAPTSAVDLAIGVPASPGAPPPRESSAGDDELVEWSLGPRPDPASLPGGPGDGVAVEPRSLAVEGPIAGQGPPDHAAPPAASQVIQVDVGRAGELRGAGAIAVSAPDGAGRVVAGDPAAIEVDPATAPASAVHARIVLDHDHDRVVVSVALRHGVVDVAIRTTDPELAAAVSSNARELAGSLRGQGLQLGDLAAGDEPGREPSTPPGGRSVARGGTSEPDRPDLDLTPELLRARDPRLRALA